MIAKLLKASAALSTLGLALVAQAQITVLDFTVGASAPTPIVEGWTLNSAPGDAGLTQTDTFLRFKDAQNDDGSLAYFETALDLSGLNTLVLDARRIEAQDGLTLTVSLFDINNNSASAVFDLSAFDIELFDKQAATLTDLFGTFDASQVAAVQFSGAVVGGTDLLNFDAATLGATYVQPVPEPSTYAAAGAGGLMLLVALRRRRAAKAA